MERIITNLIYLSLINELSYEKYLIRIKNENYVSIID